MRSLSDEQLCTCCLVHCIEQLGSFVKVQAVCRAAVHV